MTFSSRRRRAGMLGLALIVICGAASAEPTGPVDPSRPTDPLIVVLDQARLLRLPDHVATLVVGNPLIADVSVQAGGLMVITGKGYGLTNLIALDRAGKVLMSESVQVQGPPDTVVVYRGVQRESYSCTPFCERRITLGDTPEFFDQTISQAGMRNQRAQAGASGSGPAR